MVSAGVSIVSAARAAPAGAAAPSITVDGVTKRYGGREVVERLSFSVAPGEVFALLGPNGAGKTTTVEMLEGYRAPDGGRVRVLGLDPIADGAALKRRMGVMLQGGGVYPQVRPLEVLRLYAAFYPHPHDAEALLARVGLDDARKTPFRRLSGGQKQRLSLALALVGRPEVVFLDEPTAAMDPQARRATWEIIRELKVGGTRPSASRTASPSSTVAGWSPWIPPAPCAGPVAPPWCGSGPPPASTRRLSGRRCPLRWPRSSRGSTS
jgi:ABC-type Mn2+/Zn2+ transport system ATPase subunit